MGAVTVDDLKGWQLLSYLSPRDLAQLATIGDASVLGRITPVGIGDVASRRDDAGTVKVHAPKDEREREAVPRDAVLIVGIDRLHVTADNRGQHLELLRSLCKQFL